MKKVLFFISFFAIIFLSGITPAADKPVDEAKKTALDLYNTQELIYFSTVNEKGYPETRVVENVRYPGYITGKPLFAADSLDTAIVTSLWRDKVMQAKKNKKASVYIVDMASFQAVLLTGYVELVKDDAYKKAIYNKHLDTYYPKGADDPNFGVLKFKAEVIKVHDMKKNAERFNIK